MPFSSFLMQMPYSIEVNSLYIFNGRPRLWYQAQMWWLHLEGRFGILFGNPVFCYVFWHWSHAAIKDHTVEYGEATVEFGFHWTTRKGEPEAPRYAHELLWGSFKIHCLSGPHSSQQMGKEASALRAECSVCVSHRNMPVTNIHALSWCSPSPEAGESGSSSC